MKSKSKLSFQKGNAKLTKEIRTFSLPAGYTCPGALNCLTMADRETGKMTHGPQQQFVCFAAQAEAVWAAWGAAGALPLPGLSPAKAAE